MKHKGYTSRKITNLTSQPFDDVFTIENKTESVGKRIKQEAISIYQQYTKGIEVPAAASSSSVLAVGSALEELGSLPLSPSFTSMNLASPLGFFRLSSAGKASKIVVDLGLSSILDLTHKEDAHQKYIFSNSEWNLMKEYFNKNYTFTIAANLPQIIINTSFTITQLAMKKGISLR
ncbi:uncharacterized protein EV154DRAFT_561070 [Mucor mucedo]|uniref:uncharacterized protein n=1 Tax=Mucor mucedo TaxID=29922 RepID=UPI0022205732|nr:uncharacterized protein EV154DRAFT_561070 [Mucor mucedo]KAI7893793.1 hypothetical protein EV154DRAFT_561070 [Mucor mucedo]